MAQYFAELDGSGVVQRVIVADQAFIDSGRVGDPKTWVETFYDGSVGKNYAGIGYTYSNALSAFITPQPYPSWVLDVAIGRYVPPIPKPFSSGLTQWDETTQSWVTVADTIEIPL